MIDGVVPLILSIVGTLDPSSCRVWAYATNPEFIVFIAEELINVKAFIKKYPLKVIRLRGPSIPSTVAIIISKLLSSAEIEEKSLIANGNKLKTVFWAVILKDVCREPVVEPFRVISVYLL